MKIKTGLTKKTTLIFERFLCASSFLYIVCDVIPLGS